MSSGLKIKKSRRTIGIMTRDDIDRLGIKKYVFSKEQLVDLRAHDMRYAYQMAIIDVRNVLTGIMTDTSFTVKASPDTLKTLELVAAAVEEKSNIIEMKEDYFHDAAVTLMDKVEKNKFG